MLLLLKICLLIFLSLFSILSFIAFSFQYVVLLNHELDSKLFLGIVEDAYAFKPSNAPSSSSNLTSDTTNGNNTIDSWTKY